MLEEGLTVMIDLLLEQIERLVMVFMREARLYLEELGLEGTERLLLIKLVDWSGLVATMNPDILDAFKWTRTYCLMCRVSD